MLGNWVHTDTHGTPVPLRRKAVGGERTLARHAADATCTFTRGVRKLSLNCIFGGRNNL